MKGIGHRVRSLMDYYLYTDRQIPALWDNIETTTHMTFDVEEYRLKLANHTWMKVPLVFHLLQIDVDRMNDNIHDTNMENNQTGILYHRPLENEPIRSNRPIKLMPRNVEFFRL